MPPSVSVIVPVYNGAVWIEETLRAILDQTMPPGEVVVVDDSSTDDSADVIRRLPVRYHKVPNGGTGVARNIGVSLTSSDWIAFCDQDDLWKPSYIERFFATAPAEARYGFTNFAIVLDRAWQTEPKFASAPPGFFEDLSQPLYRKLLTFQPVWPSATIMQRTFFELAGRFDPRFSRYATEDFEFTLRCNEYGGAHVVFETGVGIRKHSGNYSRGTWRQHLSDIAILEWAMEHHRLGRENRRLVEESILSRARDAVGEAFAAGELASVRELANKIPARSLDMKSWLKIAVARSHCVPGSLVNALIGRREPAGVYEKAPPVGRSPCR